MIRQILCDMDGVLTNFVKGVCKLHNRPDPYTDPANFHQFNMNIIWGMTAAEFWSKCGYDFWFGLEFTPEAYDLLAYLRGKVGAENVCLLTAPCRTLGCVDGKRDWVDKYLPDFSNRLLIGSAKEFTAHPERLLVDDRDENIAAYSNAGGTAVTFPRPWNKARNHTSWHQYLDLLTYKGS